MKILNRFILLIGLLFRTSQLLAQETVNKGDIIIHISTLAPSVSLGFDYMDIYKRGAKAEIVYRKYNSLNFSDVRTDTAYTNLNVETKYKYPKKLKQIFDRHTTYDTTNVVLNLATDTVYNKILQMITQSTKQELETSIIGLRNYLDGFSLMCEIITYTEKKNISIETPMPDTHPIVSYLLDESYKRLFKKTYPK
jgi:hypothetical protein